MPLGTVYVADETPRAGAEPVFGYRLLRRLGSGGHGEVWHAEGPGGFQVALKFIRLGDGPSPADLRALGILREIRHPNLLLTFGAWEIPGYLVLGMELADRTLWDRFCEAQDEGLPGIPRDELLEYLAETAKGIDHLNGARHTLDGRERVGVQHRDLKPQNILLAGGGVKVADFGLARSLDHSLASHTGDNWTFAYAAPEFFRKQTASQSDQYSLAASYCHLRGGRAPFQGPAAVIMAGHLLFPPDLSMIPAEEREVVGRALAKAPKDRWPDCRAFVDALRKVVPAAIVAPDLLDSGPPLGAGMPQHPDEFDTRTYSRAPEVPSTWIPFTPETSSTSTEDPPSAPCPSDHALELAADRTAPEQSWEFAEIGRKAPSRRWFPILSTLAGAASILALIGLGLRASGRGDSGKLAPSSPQVIPRPPANGLRTTHLVAAGRTTPPPSDPTPEPSLETVVKEPAKPVPTAESPVLIPPVSDVVPPENVAEAIAVEAPAPVAPSLTLRGPEALTIVAGRPATLSLRVGRQGVSGPITARVEGLPPGFLAPECTTQEGADLVALKVTVPADAPACEFSARMVAEAEGVKAEGALKVTVEPSRSSALLRKGRALLEKGRQAEALAALDEAIARDPEDAAAYALRGSIHTRASAFEKAIADFGEALKRRPHDATTFNNRGLARRGLGEYHRAIADYDEALRLNPNDAIVHFNRGMAYHHLGDDVEALSDFSRAIELDPKHAPSYRARGEVLAGLGASKRSQADLDEAKRLESNPSRTSPARMVPGNARPPRESSPKRATASAPRAIVAARPG